MNWRLKTNESWKKKKKRKERKCLRTLKMGKVLNFFLLKNSILYVQKSLDLNIYQSGEQSLFQLDSKQLSKRI